MANAVFPDAKEGFLTGAIDWDTGVFKIALVRGYTYTATHTYVSDVTVAGGTLHTTSAALASKTFADGVVDAADVDLGTVAANASNHSVLLFQSSAPTGGADVAATSQRLVAWFDTGTNFPVIPNGGNITIAWGSYIFAV